MSESSEAAEQVVRMALSGGEITVRLAGAAVKNIAAILLALAQNHKKVYGKTSFKKMLGQTRDIRQFTMTPEQFRLFRRKARSLRILYSAVRDRLDEAAPVDVLLPTTELERANMIFEQIRYAPQPEQEQANQTQTKEERPKKESRSERGSRDTRDKSSTRSGRDRTTSDRPSVEQQLQKNKAALDKQRVPARQRTRTKSKAR